MAADLHFRCFTLETTGRYNRRARVPLPPADLDLASGHARLSYRRAAEYFETATENLPVGPGPCTSCGTQR
jgi:hypothetical protein